MLQELAVVIVAITGGSGFIGRRLVARHVALGDEIRVLSRRAGASLGLPLTTRFWQADLADPHGLEYFTRGADVLYHCAAEIRQPALMERVHVDGTRALIAAAAHQVRRWVNLSSGGVYGRRRHGTVNETVALLPSGAYETTKAKSDELVAEAGRAGAFEHVILRPSNVYGPEMPNQSLFGLIAMIEKGLFFFIGAPGASANYVHVANVVDAMVLCGSATQAEGEIYNLSDYRTMEYFVAMISSALGLAAAPKLRLPEMPVRLAARLAGALWKGSPLTESRVDALTTRVVYSSAKIKRELGYRHSVSMEDGVAELVSSRAKRAPNGTAAAG